MNTVFLDTVGLVAVLDEAMSPGTRTTVASRPKPVSSTMSRSR
jgi:hypothetical protein